MSLNFVDRVLIALAVESSRATVFSEEALRNVVKAGYGLDDTAISGVPTARFSTFSLGGFELDAKQPTWPELLATDRVDALWRGSVQVSSSFPRAVVQEVELSTLSLATLDADVATANGGVMPAGDALELARRVALRNRLATLAAHPEATGNGSIDELLARAGVTTLAELLSAPGVASLSQLRIAFSPPIGGEAFTLFDFPVAVAVLIRDPSETGFHLATLVSAARRVQQEMRRAGFEPKPGAGAVGQGKALVAVVVPETWFDDTAWPGGTAAQRLANAGAWMAREGMALATSV